MVRVLVCLCVFCVFVCLFVCLFVFFYIWMRKVVNSGQRRLKMLRLHHNNITDVKPKVWPLMSMNVWARINFMSMNEWVWVTTLWVWMMSMSINFMSMIEWVWKRLILLCCRPMMWNPRFDQKLIFWERANLFLLLWTVHLTNELVH